MEIKEQSFGNTKINFPVDVNFKVIMNDTFPNEVNIVHIANVIEDTGLDYREITSVNSKQKNYTSYTFQLTVKTETQFKELYERIRQVPGFVMAF